MFFKNDFTVDSIISDFTKILSKLDKVTNYNIDNQNVLSKLIEEHKAMIILHNENIYKSSKEIDRANKIKDNINKLISA